MHVFCVFFCCSNEPIQAMATGSEHDLNYKIIYEYKSWLHTTDADSSDV